MADVTGWKQVGNRRKCGNRQSRFLQQRDSLEWEDEQNATQWSTLSPCATEPHSNDVGEYKIGRGEIVSHSRILRRQQSHRHCMCTARMDGVVKMSQCWYGRHSLTQLVVELLRRVVICGEMHGVR